VTANSSEGALSDLGDCRKAIPPECAISLDASAYAAPGRPYQQALLDQQARDAHFGSGAAWGLGSRGAENQRVSNRDRLLGDVINPHWSWLIRRCVGLQTLAWLRRLSDWQSASQMRFRMLAGGVQ